MIESKQSQMDNASFKRISAVVPAYCEQETIQVAMSRLASVLDGLSTDWEIIVVSDGSTDNTAGEVRSLGQPKIKCIEYHPNRGKGYALKQGFRVSTGDLVAFCDADLDIHPECLPFFVDKIRDCNVDVVVGSKFHPQSKVSYPYLRRVQSKAFIRIVRWLFTLDVSDTQTGMKVFKRAVLDECLPSAHARGFSFDLELLIEADRRRYSIAEAPVVLDYEYTSSVKARDTIVVLRDILKLYFRR